MDTELDSILDLYSPGVDLLDEEFDGDLGVVDVSTHFDMDDVSEDMNL